MNVTLRYASFCTVTGHWSWRCRRALTEVDARGAAGSSSPTVTMMFRCCGEKRRGSQSVKEKRRLLPFGTPPVQESTAHVARNQLSRRRERTRMHSSRNVHCEKLSGVTQAESEKLFLTLLKCFTNVHRTSCARKADTSLSCTSATYTRPAKTKGSVSANTLRIDERVSPPFSEAKKNRRTPPGPRPAALDGELSRESSFEASRGFLSKKLNLRHILRNPSLAASWRSSQYARCLVRASGQAMHCGRLSSVSRPCPASLSVRGSGARTARCTERLGAVKYAMVRYTELEEASGGEANVREAGPSGPFQDFRQRVIAMDPHLFARKSLHQIMVRGAAALRQCSRFLFMTSGEKNLSSQSEVNDAGAHRLKRELGPVGLITRALQSRVSVCTAIKRSCQLARSHGCTITARAILMISVRSWNRRHHRQRHLRPRGKSSA